MDINQEEGVKMKYIKKSEFKKANYFGTGFYNFVFAKNMTGKTYMKPLKMIGKQEYFFVNVSFAPGARCFWHIHRGTTGGGQILLCTAGEGWYQEKGKEPVSLTPGMVIDIPTDVEHWHGAKKDSWFSHITIEIGGEGVKNEFVRPVSENEYNALPNLSSVISGGTGFDKENVFGKGHDNDAYAQYFIGKSYLNPKILPVAGRPSVANVTFEPGCRNNWHIHKASSGGGQVLVCTAGEGWYQEEGKKAQSLKPGSIIYIPAGIKHWHGAKKDKWFSHLAVEIPGADAKSQWLEPVSNAEYSKL